MLQDTNDSASNWNRRKLLDKYSPEETARRVVMHDCQEKAGKVIWGTIESMLILDIPVVSHAAKFLFNPVIGTSCPENKNVLLKVDNNREGCSLIVCEDENEFSELVFGRTFFTGCKEYRVLALVHEAKHIEVLQKNSSIEFPDRFASEKLAIAAELEALIALAERREGLGNIIPGYQEMLDMTAKFKVKLPRIIYLYAWVHLERPALNTTEIQGIVEESLKK